MFRKNVGRLDSLVLDLPVVSGQTGLDIAHALLETVKHQSLMVEDIKQQLVDGAMDGQYFTNEPFLKFP